jgi:phage terminase large subunit
MDKEIKVTRVFYENAGSKKPLVINRGGTRSTKSHSLTQLMLFRFFTQKNKKILALRKTLPAMRVSVFTKFREIAAEFGKDFDSLQSEKVMMNYYFGTNTLHFGGMDDPEKIKSTEWNYVFVEEANEFDYEDILQLSIRLSAKTTPDEPNQLFLAFNPIDEYHWIKQKLMVSETGNYDEIVSTYKDNPTLDETYIRKLENLVHQNKNFYRVYVLGEWGRYENLVYDNWRITREEPFEFEDKIFGLDFGFNNPTAMLRIGIKDDEFFEKELIYESKLTTSALIEMMREVLSPDEYYLPIYCDSASPGVIEELQTSGFNCLPMKKGPGSVFSSINFVKGLNINVHESSDNLIKEKRSYSWKTDKRGNPVDEPVKFMDHLMDCEKGALYTHLSDSYGDVDVSFF